MMNAAAEVWTNGSCEEQGLRDEGRWRSFERRGDPWVGDDLKVNAIHHCGAIWYPLSPKSFF